MKTGGKCEQSPALHSALAASTPHGTSSMSSIVRPSLLACRSLVPPLAPTAYKGQAGKVAVIGGSAEYTGAPFYAAISALKLGADLSHVFCDAQAAVPIKCYSPELIVHGCLQAGETSHEAQQQQAEEVCKWFPALSALVVGPGLGRDPALQAVAAMVVERAVSMSLPCVIDADGLRIVLERPQLVKGSPWTVLTPNKPEYARLVAALDLQERDGEEASKRRRTELDKADEADELLHLARSLDGPTIVRKGAIDRISDGCAPTLTLTTGSATAVHLP